MPLGVSLWAAFSLYLLALTHHKRMPLQPLTLIWRLKGGALCFHSQKNEVVAEIIPEKRLRVLDKVKPIAVVQGYVATNVFRLLVLKVRAFFF